MKNLRTSVLVLALIAGISGAAVTKATSAPKTNDPLYDWVRYDTDGTTIIGMDSQVSVADEEKNTNCKFSATRCAVGTAPSQPTITLHYLH